jgi:hypothetical protein
MGNPGSQADSDPAVYNDVDTGVTDTTEAYVSDVRTTQENDDAATQVRSGGVASNQHTTAVNHDTPLQDDSPLRIGKVLLAYPYIHCYKVQYSGRQGSDIATACPMASMMPIGVRSGEVIPPNSDVIVWKPSTGKLCYILGVVPSSHVFDKMNVSDHIQQGGNSGVKKVPVYTKPITATTNAMDWVSQSSNRPMDGTVGEYVRMSETGIGLLIDSFQAYLRINEACGLWLNYFDNYAKLAGMSLNLMSYCKNSLQYYDEGENSHVEGYCTYPWEATGMYGPGEKFSKEYAEDGVQLDRNVPFGLEDVEDFSQTAVYRLTDYHGYLGQGFNRTLMSPAKAAGKRLMTDAAYDQDTGLFNELIALDGSYSLRSAKSILFCKYPAIPNPRRVRLVEDGKGDDGYEPEEDEEGNLLPTYRFSGVYGGEQSVQHKVNPIDYGAVGTLPNVVRPAGVMDLIAHHYNWKSTHPFDYHVKDYNYPEEKESKIGPVQFKRGNFTESYVPSQPTGSLKIDSRYGDVDYFGTMSFFSMHDDGSISIGDGYGSQIVMTGGQIRLEAGGDVMLVSGSRVVAMGKETIVRALGSVDISSSQKDVRVKAENNLQLLGGNNTTGAVLIESKSQGTGQYYRNRVGEDAAGGGITMLSRGGSFNVMTQNVYLRSGVGKSNAEDSGVFVVDVANGQSSFVTYANAHLFFNSIGLGIWHSPVGQDDVSIDKSHFFSPFVAKVNGPTVMNKTVVICDKGDLGVDRGVYAKKDIITLRYLYSRKAKVFDSTPIEEEVKKFIDDFCSIGPVIDALGTPLFNVYYTNYYWQPTQSGNTSLLENEIGFSYRDKTEIGGGDVYGYEANKFFFAETRFQQLERVDAMPGTDETWTEKPVNYQGKSLYPWPGKKHWVDTQAGLQYNGKDKWLLFDPAGYAKDRKENRTDYESPKIQNWNQIKLDGNFTL